MRKFDPWPVFFRREWSRNWPFLVGFFVAGTVNIGLSSALIRGCCPPMKQNDQVLNLALIPCKNICIID
ncbi:hypothetical protein CsSME_00024979 [Camellia sinensis var. sinensis]